MTEPLPDTWNSRDLPVLRALVDGVDRDTRRRMGVRIDAVTKATGLDEDDAAAAISALSSAGLIEQRAMSFGDRVDPVVKVSADARRLAGSWPSPETALDRMVKLLEQISANSDDATTQKQAVDLRRALLAANGALGMQLAVAALGNNRP